MDLKVITVKFSKSIYALELRNTFPYALQRLFLGGGNCILFEALFSSKTTVCVNQEILLKELHYVWLFYFAYSNRGKEGNILEV